MIRINLLPSKTGRTKATKAKSGEGQTFQAILIAVITAELLFCYLWYQDADEAMMMANANVARQKKSLADTKRKQDKPGGEKTAETSDEEVKLLKRETNYFDRLMPERNGYVELLQFVAYTLTKLEDNSANKEELIRQQQAGWKDKVIRVEEEPFDRGGVEEEKALPICQRLTDTNCKENWHPKFIWPTRFSVKEKKISMEGLARSHEYVAEFYSRLRSGIYFLNFRQGKQEKVKEETFQNIELVQFELSALFNPVSIFDEKELEKMEIRLAAGAVPEELKHLIVEEAKPEEDKDKKGKKGKPAKKGKKGK
tara:strand:+ start:1208 stop:2140 length:933 start_codon:yes stop_codon:yes gene_type:complete